MMEQYCHLNGKVTFIQFRSITNRSYNLFFIFLFYIKFFLLIKLLIKNIFDAKNIIIEVFSYLFSLIFNMSMTIICIKLLNIILIFIFYRKLKNN